MADPGEAVAALEASLEAPEGVAPLTLQMAFIRAVQKQDMHEALRLSNEILQIQPDHELVKEYQPVLMGIIAAVDQRIQDNDAAAAAEAAGEAAADSDEEGEDDDDENDEDDDDDDDEDDDDEDDEEDEASTRPSTNGQSQSVDGLSAPPLPTAGPTSGVPGRDGPRMSPAFRPVGMAFQARVGHDVNGQPAPAAPKWPWHEVADQGADV
mmetsp:Transcript_9312/g.20304  ORF Transcript_9312/g.20304 Transcript_9312/m.20304 type:complete len:210 (-) Transcript_9312:121-750(-)